MTVSKRKNTKQCIWEFQAGNIDDPFILFDYDFASAVEKEFETGVSIANITYAGTNYEIKFDTIPMTQRNKESNTTRQIRRQTAMWFYEDDEGLYKPFSLKYSNDLEDKATVNTDTCFKIIMFRTSYHIDLLTMSQRNEESGKIRNIVRRGGSDLSICHTTGGKEPPTKKAHVEAAATTALATTLGPNSGGVCSDGGIHSNSVIDTKDDDAVIGATTMKLIKKGSGVVDTMSLKQDTHHVYSSGHPDNILYQCTLNQTNIGANNNKYYIMQLLQHDNDPNQLLLFTRWGRVGASGQCATENFIGNLNGAIAAYKRKFKDKTHNVWGGKESFTMVPGKYFLMDIDIDGMKGDEQEPTHDNKKSQTVEKPDCTLHPAVKGIMELISNKSTMSQTMEEFEIDTSKMPLGKISKKQIKDAFRYLKNIETELQKPVELRDSNVLVSASSMFYTLVPHSFGKSSPPTIDSNNLLNVKMKLLETLADLEIASKILCEGEGVVDKNPLDYTYDSLKCQLIPIDYSSEVYQRICRYVKNTHADTHNTYNLTVLDVLIVKRSEDERYVAMGYSSMSNRQMLWHGSRTTNFIGILSQGLRIAPPEAPSTGYMFGKGVYFANCVSKSANYCYCSKNANIGILLLCEAALGVTGDHLSAHYMTKPANGTESTLGLGMSAPCLEEAETDEDGVLWPLGTIKKVPGCKSDLLYPEMIVYDVAQCRIRYLVKLRFDFK